MCFGLVSVCVTGNPSVSSGESSGQVGCCDKTSSVNRWCDRHDQNTRSLSSGLSDRFHQKPRSQEGEKRRSTQIQPTNKKRTPAYEPMSFFVLVSLRLTLPGAVVSCN